MTNFDFLLSTPDFDAFADVAISAERPLRHATRATSPKVGG